MQIGSAQVVTNPTSLTVCLGSPATFTCVINGTVGTVDWLINGSDAYLFSPFYMTNTQPDGLKLLSTLTISTDIFFYETTIACQYNESSQLIHSSSALLHIQGRHSAPTNATSIALNATSSMLIWQPPYDVLSQPLSFVVKISDLAGVNIYTVTVMGLQTAINLPNPCESYEALIRPQCPNHMPINNDTVDLQGAPPAIISHVDVSFPSSSKDNVTVSIVESGVCYYSVVALTGSMSFDFPELRGLSAVTLSLPPKYNYSFIINAFNVYGNTTSTIALNTFDVTGIASITASTTSLYCNFSSGSQAIGCLAQLTEVATGASFCVVIPRYANSPVNTSQCPAPTNCSNVGLSSLYTVGVYDISGDGKVSTKPSIRNVTLSLVQDFCNNQPNEYTPSVTIYAIIGGTIGGAIVVGMILIFIIGCIISISRKAHYNVKQKKASEKKDKMDSNIVFVNKDATQEKDAVQIPLGYELVAQRTSTLY
eukprot:Em0010g683a